MTKNKQYSIILSKLLLVIFFLPIITLFIHSFSNHKHEICNSKETTHFHHKDIECTLHLIKLANSNLTDYEYQFLSKENFTTSIDIKNNFLPSHKQLSFSLRAPPLYVIL